MWLELGKVKGQDLTYQTLSNLKQRNQPSLIEETKATLDIILS
jgi:hypothetical protein